MDQTHDRLALIEVFDRDGRLHHAQDVFAWPVTLGRALHNSVVLDDPHVAPSHARLELAEDGRLQLAIGPSLNGGQLGRRRLAAGDHAELTGSATHHFQLGATRLRLRLPDAAIAPERPMAAGTRPLLTTLPLLIALAALVAWPVWLARDPGDDWRGWLPIIVGGPAALLVWCGAWALASKIFQHRFDFWGHLGVAVRVMVVAEVIELVLPQLAASMDWPTLWRATNWLTPLALAVLCWSHARRVLPDHQRGLALLVTVIWGVATGVTLTTNQQRHDRFNAEPYMSTLPLPMFRWYSAVPSREFVDEARKLQAPLQERVKEAQDEDKGDEP